MSTLIALLTLALMAVSSFFTDGSVRYFDLNTKKGVAPLSVTFNSQTLKDAKLAEKFIWTFGDGQTLTTTNISVLHTYTTPGTFTAKLQYLTKATDAISKIKDGGSVKVVVTPKPNALPIPKLSCISNEYNKVECDPIGSVDSDGTITNYKYDWGDTTSTVATSADKASHIYTASGDKTIQLTVTDNVGATAFIEKTISVKSNTAPIAAFTCTKTGVLQIHCANSSTDAEEALLNFKWTLDDGTVYTTKDFDHTFNKRAQDVAISSHAVTLLAKDSQGLTSTLTKSVDVDLEALTTLPRGYFKVYMQGTSVNLHTFIVKTQFEIKRAFYTVYGASSTPLQTIELNEFYANTVNKVNLGSYGNYKIVLTAIDMRDQVFQTSRTFNLTENTYSLAPYVDYRATQTGPRKIYLNLTPSFDYDEYFYITDFTIDMGDGVQKKIVDDTFLTYTYANAGTYTLKITAKTVHGTQTVITRNITVTNDEAPIYKPDPTFAYEVYDYAQNVSFYNEKSGTPNGQIISYVWDFGDGSTATGETQAHFYAPGSYLVTLTVTDTAGMTATQLQRVTILAEGNDLVAHLNCGRAAPFVDITQNCEVVALDKLNDISSVKIIWGNGTSSILTTPADITQGLYYPTSKYSVAGTYAVKLVVTTNRGVVAATTKSITLTARPPIATINCMTNNLLANCNTMGSFDPKGGLLTFTFNYQDGFVETNTTGFSSHAYQTAGFYNVSVTVADNTGLSSVAMTPVQIIAPRPVANIQCSVNNLMAFCNALGSYDPLMKGLVYEFDYGDGFKESNVNGISSHAYTSAGLYTVNLRVVDYIGSDSLASSQVQAVLPINKLPHPQLYCYSNAPNILRCNANSSYDEDGSLVAFMYGWDDGLSETHAGAEEIFHIFAGSGPHQVTLSVTDNDGGVKSIIKSFDVQSNNPPVAAIYCYNIGPQKIHCNSNSYDVDPSDTIAEYKWDMGDGSSSITTLVPSIEYLYSEIGTYSITLEVKDLMGAMASSSQSIQVIENQAPVANLNCSITTGSTYQCNANAYDPDGQILESSWTIEGQTFSGQSVLYNFTNGGDKNIQFVAKDNLGKVTTATISLHIDKPIVDLSCLESTPFHITCKYAKPTEEEKTISVVRYFIDGNDVFEGETLEYDFLTAGEHKIVIVVYAADLTSASFEKTIFINNVHLSPKAKFTNFADIGYKVKFDSSDSFMQGRKVVSFKWNFGDGNQEIVGVGEVIHTFQTSGNYKVVLSVTDDQGAINTITKSVYVYDPEVPNPGDINSDTLAGVDFDNDGVRDDVQRWINFEVKDNLVAKSLLRQLAKDYQLQIINNNDSANVNNLELNKEKVTTCLLGQVNNDELVNYYQGMLQYLYTSTEIRSKAWSIVQGNLGGYSGVVPSDDQSVRILSCEHL